MAIFYSQLSDLGKYMELIQKSMELLTTIVMNLQLNIQNIEAKVEIATVGILEEVFSYGEPAHPAKGIAGAVNCGVEHKSGVCNRQSLGVPSDEATRDVDLGSHR